jgi:hypothetical protein
MTELQSNYPIGQLLIAAVKQSNQPLSAFVSSIGFSNTNKGIRHFRNALASGIVAPVLVERLMASSYAPSLDLLQDAFRETAAILNSETLSQTAGLQIAARAAFRPYIAPLTELQRPTSITIFAILGGFSRLTIELPQSFPNWNSSLQTRYAQAKIRAHYRRFGGEAPLLGAIVGYQVFPAFGESCLHFSIDGQLLGSSHNNTPKSVCVLRTKGGQVIPTQIIDGRQSDGSRCPS